MRRALTDFKALSFDCYGTLIDWETGIWDALQPLLMTNGCKTLHRQDALECFARNESAIETRHPDIGYREVLTRVHAAFAENFNLKSDDDLNAAFGCSVGHWPAFPDTETRCDT